MVGLFKTLFIILVIYYVLRLFTRYVVPFFAKRYINKMQKDLYNQQYQQGNHHKKKREGDVIINGQQQRSNKKDSNKDIGEYVDYEEVKDD